jgi:rubrerythrin
MLGRRHLVTAGLAATAALILARGGATALAQSPYKATAEILERSRSSEADAYRQYLAFAKQADADGYKGIAYMFTALATAELIHGRNFETVLVRLGVEVQPPPQHPIQVASTRENLIKAAADELDCVQKFYPEILKQLKPEGFQDAITMTNYAWESEKQHFDILKEIQRWSPNHFEAVAKRIENETGQYFVCRICGSTSVQIPREKCPICKFPSENYRKVDPPV